MKSGIGVLEVENVIKRALTYGINVARLQDMLGCTPTERLEMLRACTPQGESAIARAVAYGIDISLLELALSWTPTERLEALERLIASVHELHAAGAKQHGI